MIDELEKEAFIPYTMYRKEQTSKYKNDVTKRHNWTYDEQLDYYVDHQGVQFSFSHCSQHQDKQGFQRNFRVYKADKVQETGELDQLALTPKGACRTTSVNYVWESYKQEVKEALTSESGSRLYA